MRCLSAVSGWFEQRASLTVNIDLSDVTNKYYTVLYRTVVVYEKKNRSLVFSGSRKIPTLGSTVQWETRQASFPTGTVGPRVGIFLSPLNTNDGFYLSHMGNNNGNPDLVCDNINFPRMSIFVWGSFGFRTVCLICRQFKSDCYSIYFYSPRYLRRLSNLRWLQSRSGRIWN